MNLEKLIVSILAATPATRRRIETVLAGTDTGTRQEAMDADTRLVTISGAARLLNVGRNVVYNLVKTERLDTVELNGSKRITMRSLTAFLNGERPANEKTDELIAASKARWAATKAAKGGVTWQKSQSQIRNRRSGISSTAPRARRFASAAVAARTFAWQTRTYATPV